MDTTYEEGGSQTEIAGAEQLPNRLQPEDLFAEPPRAARPSWMATRFPIALEEFAELNREAEKPDRKPTEAIEDTTPADADMDPRGEFEEDFPEDDSGEPGAAPAALAPPTRVSFEGIPQTAFLPPDCTCAVGRNDVMLGVNTDLAVYSKNGQLRFRWPNMTNLFRRVMPAGAGLFDPVFRYDHYLDRWIVIIAARRQSPPGSWLMVGVSQTEDPGGAYWVWALDATLNGSNPTQNWADYPMVGFDTQAIYIMSNMFAFGGNFAYCKLRILNKAELYTGGVGPTHTIRYYDIWNLRNPDNTIAFSVQPCSHYRGRGGNPPAYLVNALWPDGETLTVWDLRDPVGFWNGRRPILSNRTVACRRYSLPPDGEQPGTPVRIETNDTRLLNAIYQHASGTRRIWTAHTTRLSWAGDSAARSGVQWYEIDVPTGTVAQQNAYGASGRYYFFPAIQIDLHRNAYIVFGRCGSSEFASLRQTGRRVNAQPNDLENSRLIKRGEGLYTGGRWGDYFGVGRDPADPFAVWVYGEYAETGRAWGTWTANLKF